MAVEAPHEAAGALAAGVFFEGCDIPPGLARPRWLDFHDFGIRLSEEHGAQRAGAISLAGKHPDARELSAGEA